MYRAYYFVFLLCLVFVSSYAKENFSHKDNMESVHAPQYLYKIVSLRLWHATQNRNNVTLSAEDDAFIHFSTEDQLERIIDKFWSEVPQYVILKIETAKVTGEWAYETNPGGTTRFYHLYKGFIPINAIAEAKIVYQKSQDSCEAPKLGIVQIGHPVLRQKAQELSAEEILSPEIQTLIQEMIVTMRAAPGVGLAAPQIGRPVQVVVIEDMDHSLLTPEQLLERDRQKVALHVIINPRIDIEETEAVEFFEGCLSVPQFVGLVPRAKSVRVECLNEHAEPVTIRAKGWYARILQHEIDHLNGILYIDRARLATLMTEENYVKLWKSKSRNEILASLALKKENPFSCHNE